MGGNAPGSLVGLIAMAARLRTWSSAASVALLLVLQGCAVATVKQVLVGERAATPAEHSAIEIVRDGALLETRLQMRLESGDRLSTGQDRTALIHFPSGANVIVFPGTIVIVSSLKVNLGELLVILEKIRGTFEVETEDFVAGASGTEFFVTRDAAGGGTVSVLEGRVELRSLGGQWPAMSVATGERAAVQVAGPTTVTAMDRATYDRLVERAHSVHRAFHLAAAPILVPRFGPEIPDPFPPVPSRSNY